MESNTLPSDNELIAQFMGFERIEVGYTGTDSETQWQREHREWMDEVMMDSVGIYYVNVPENKYEWEDDIAYDTSWDWLMPVIQKIDSLYDKAFPPDFVQKLLAKEPTIDDHYMDVIALPLSTKINEAHKAVVEFIKYYNSQNPKL